MLGERFFKVWRFFSFLFWDLALAKLIYFMVCPLLLLFLLNGITLNAQVVTWGQGVHGGDSSSVASELSSGVSTIYSNRYAFAALKDDGSVVTWGSSYDPTDGSYSVISEGDLSSVASELSSGVSSIYSTEYAFAALKNDGSVVTWGTSDYGGDSSSVASELSSGVSTIYSNWTVFAALKDDGSVVTWGLSNRGSDSSSVASELSSGVSSIYSTKYAFAALKDDGSVVTWGSGSSGGDSSSVASELSSGVSSIYSTEKAFAALKDDGSVVTWGRDVYGGDSSSVASELSSGVSSIYSNAEAFAALKNDGSVITWGYFGGDSSSVASELSSGFSTIYSNRYAFAALKDDGSVVTWGIFSSGGYSGLVASELSSGVSTIYSNQHAFAALKNDGSVVTWGDVFYGGDSSSVASELSSGVSSIYSTEKAFAALKDDGSVVTWGASGDRNDFEGGGDSSSVASELSSGVTSITPNRTAFAALILDTDRDGVVDSRDAYPNDPYEWLDTDGDNVGDNSDAFPNDSNEWLDTDGDGAGDNTDVFPSDINYQGRLTDVNGNAVTGDVSMSVKMYDAQNGGNEIYSEDIGTVTLDENGVYSFQFGASGNSTVTKTETIVTTDGSSTNYTGTFTSTPIDGTISVTDETYSWNDTDGNPGEQATAYIIIINGFVIYADIENGGSGYDDDNPPLVTITGDGSGATATATVENGVVTGIALPNAGNNYTEGDIIIAPPPAPFTVDKVNGSLEVGYTSSPSNGTELVVTYKTLERTIMGALSEASAHWLELTVDGVAQNPRERIVSVPFAQVALNANSYKVGFKDYLARDNGIVYKESSSGFLFVQPRSGTGVSGEVYLGKSFESLEVVSSYRTASSGHGVPTSSASSSSLIPIPEGYFWRANGYEKISFVPFLD
jgi:hypothetical protein